MMNQQFQPSPRPTRSQSFFSLSSCSLSLAIALLGSLLNTGAVLAQALEGDAPSAADLVQPAPAPSAPVAAPAPAPAAERTPELPRRRQRAAAPAPEVPAAPERLAAPERPATPERPTTSERPAERPATPQRPATANTPQLPDAADLMRPSPAAERNVPTNYSDLYIDTTRYDIGATGNERPGVVLSERSTGCQVNLQSGQGAPGQICGVVGGSGAIAQGQGTGRNAPGVNIGPIRVTRQGVFVNPIAVQDFYNRTVRPLALAGNGNSRLMFPLPSPVAITSSFGWRIHPIFGSARFHYGTDLGAPMGTPVIAAYTGQVDVASYMRGYGLTVALRHNNGTVQTLYAHLSEVFVRPGEAVRQGEVIGRVGSTGNSTGPHLHFEYRELTRDGWVARDPGGILQNAVAGIMQQPLQVVPLAAAPTVADSVSVAVTGDKLALLQVRSLQDFGKLAGPVQPMLNKQTKPKK